MNYQSLISSIWCNCTQPFNLLLLFLTLGFSPATVHAQQTPCDCAQRWEKGAHWNPDGTINDAPNAPAPLGIIRCGSSAETQAQLIPGTCTYDPNQFYIDVELAPCVEPSTGVSVSAKNPKAGQPIIWLNFDVRANAGSFQVQINDNSGDKIAWALYYSTTHQAGVNNNGLSGNCNTLVFAACGVESASTWNTLPVPSFSQPTNYYMAIWDQNADGNLAVNNFKARFGCGDADVLVCNLEVSPETTQCQEDTYTVEIPIQGINSNYVGYDPNATPPTSAPVCLTNSGTTDVTSGTIIMTYPQSVTNYNIEISIDDNPDDDCPDPANPGDCSTIVSGTAPDCCTGPVISCPEDVTVSCEQSLDPADIGSAEAAEGCGEVTISHTDELFPGGCATETIIKRTWTATDEDGNTDDCVQTITVQDNTAPIPPPAPQNITISCSGLVPEPVELMALDNCGGEIPGIPSSGIIVGECVNEYEIERVWIFTDACGNTSSVSQTITVKDTEAPATPEPPADATYQCAAEVPVAESLTTTDNCEGELTVMPTEETFPSECASDFVLIRTWTFADECGNSTSVSQTITVQDTEAPATPEPPADATYQCASDVPAADELSTTDNCDGELTVEPTEATFPGECANDYVLVRTWTFTDQCGNSSSVTQTITVKDTEAPATPEPPADATYQCASDVPAADELSTTDNCDGELTIDPTEETFPGECANDYVLVRTWTFTDQCGNSSSVTQTITVKDTEAPAIPEPPADATYPCASDVPAADELSTTDNCDGELTVDPTEATFPGECANDYVLVRTWTFTDQCGNSSSVSQTITVKDTEAPATPEPPADATYQCASDVPASDELSTTDNCDGELTVDPTEQTFPGECANDYVLVRTWTFTDQCGNSSSVSQTITVKDTEAPATPEPPVDATYQCASDVPAADELSTTDNCDGELTVEPTEETFPGECANAYVLVRTWTFTDQCGNSSSVSQTITVKDTEAPATPEPPTDATYQCASDVPASDELSTTDNCDGELTVDPTEETFPGECANDYVLVRTWTFTDQCGNSSSVFQTITVKDTEAPATPEPPADATYQCASDVPTADELSTTDNCDGELTVEPTEATFPGECANDFVLVRTWTFTDQCGNSSSVSQTITVKDTEAPATPEPPADATYQCASNVPAADELSTTDNCDGELTVQPTEQTFPGECANDFVLVRTWTFTDQCGNSSSVFQTITVKDTEAPATPEPPADATYQCVSDVPAADELSTTDNCDDELTVDPTEETFPGECANDYILVRTWTFTDQCGNSSSVFQTITVKDTEAPATPEPPADATYQCASDVPAADELSTTDNCDDELTVDPTEETFPGECANDYILVRTWTFTDQCGNSSSVSQTITVKDTEAPVPQQQPTKIRVYCADDVPAPQPLSAIDNCDGMITVMPIDNVKPGACPNDFVITRTWTFTDQCGNRTKVSQKIRVKDTRAPKAPKAPADLTVQCASDVPLPVELTAVDNCEGNIVVFPTEDIVPGSCINDYILVRTWTFTDQCGNSSSVSQTITVKDTEAPATPEPPADATYQCASDVPAADVLSTTDNCDGDLTTRPTEATFPGECANDYVLVRTWTFTDQCGNSSSVSQTITVKDTEAPATPAPPADATYQCADEVPVAEELSTTDNCDGEIIVMPTETTMTGSCANDVVFIRTWTFTDQCGNSSSVSQTLTVKDTEAPATPEAPADITVQCAGDVPAIEKLTTTDNCSGELSALPTEQLIVGSCPNDYTIVRTWTFTDDCGNSTSVSQTITVKDTEAPVAPEPPADITIQCTDDIPDQVDLTATDNCDGDITVSPDEVATEPEICDNNYTITRTWTFTDQCGNSSSVSQLITVKDETAPVLLVELGLTNLSCVDQIPPYEEVLGLIGENIYDECDSGLPTVNLVEDTGEPNCIDGVFARTYSVEVCDACGNCAVYQLTYSGQCGEFCTLTQGGWGNAGGKYPWPDADGKATTTEIITALMDANGPIIIGDLAGNSLTIEDPDCVLALLPGGGPSGPLPTGTNVVNNGNNCKPADASMLNKQGRLNNNLVAQTVALQINVWYSSMAKGTNLGDLLLGGACLPINGSGLPETVQTVQDLLDYTNAYLGGAVSGGNSLSGALNTAVSGINEYFDGCKLPPVFKEQPADDPVDEEPTGEEPLTCDEFCTLTQGGWGNAGGQYTWNDADGKAYTEDIISALMDKYGDIILGNPQSMRSLTVKDPGCAITLLPAGGSAMPLPAGHAFSSKPNKCRVYGTDQQRKNGRLNNVLAGQVVALQLNIWYSSEMYGSDLGATTLGGECLPVNTEGLPPSIGTVADLLNYANLVLNNQVGSDYAGLLLTGQSDLPTQLAPVLTDAITKVNEYFDGCQPAAFVNEHLVTDRMNDPQLDITAGLKELRLTPNPAMDQVTIDFNTSEEGETRLRINDLQGREVYRAEQLSVTGNNMFRVNTDDLSSGLYIVTLLQGDALLQSKLVIVKE